MSTEHNKPEPNSGSLGRPLSEEELALLKAAAARKNQQRKNLKRFRPDDVFDAVCQAVLWLRQTREEQTDAVNLLSGKEYQMLEDQLGRAPTAAEAKKLHSDNTWRKVIKRRIGPWRLPASTTKADPTQTMLIQKASVPAYEGRPSWNRSIA